MECIMNTKQFSSIRRRQTGRTGKISLLLLAVPALLLVLGGCGGLNDDPADGGLSVRFGFSDSGGASSAEASPATAEPQVTAEPQAIVSPKGDVLTVVIGAIVITQEKNPGNGIEAYTTADVATGIEETQREALESDLEQSITFLEIVQLPTSEDTVSFPIPPDNAGKWQLLAVGMRHRIEALDEIENNSPIYYGFIGQFLNGQVTAGQEVSQSLQLIAACGIDDPIVPCP